MQESKSDECLRRAFKDEIDGIATYLSLDSLEKLHTFAIRLQDEEIQSAVREWSARFANE